MSNVRQIDKMNIKKGIIVMGILSSFFGLGGCKESNPEVVREELKVDITAQLNHLIMPLDRAERYEDPLNEALIQKRFGETDGGGTMQLQSGEIEYIDVEIILSDLTGGIPFVVEQLEAFGAPKGSILKIHDSDPSREIPFGKKEGIAVYLDGVNLPDETYATSDINVVIEELNKSLGGKGEMQSYWEGSTETALYLYGDNADEMKQLIGSFMSTYPLCKNARIVTIAPKQAEQAH
jgi:hypothetical protein